MTAFTTPKIGPSLRVLSVLLTWIAVVVWPPFAIVGITVGSAVFGFLYPIAAGFLGDNLFLDGFDAIKKTSSRVPYLWTAHTREIRSWSTRKCAPLAPGDQPVDINLVRVPVACVMWFIGTLCFLFAAPFTGVAFYLPVVISTYIGFVSASIAVGCPLGICAALAFLVAVPCVPVLAALAWALALIASPGLGLITARISYDRDRGISKSMNVTGEYCLKGFEACTKYINFTTKLVR